MTILLIAGLVVLAGTLTATVATMFTGGPQPLDANGGLLPAAEVRPYDLVRAWSRFAAGALLGTVIGAGLLVADLLLH